MSQTIGAVYEFGSFRLDAARRRLMQNDRALTLPPKTFDLLILLVESRGRVLTKKELMGALWPDTFVEEANLTFQISTLRKALGPEASEWIETLPRYGYCFSGKVLEVDPGSQRGALCGCSQKRLPCSTLLLSARIGVSLIGFRRGWWRLPPHILRSCIYESRHP